MPCDTGYEELSSYASGELDELREAEIEAHLAECGGCRERLAALSEVDVLLRSLPRIRPTAGAIFEARKVLSRELRDDAAPEIMTLEEVAEFLRLSRAELGDVVDELPAFEIAGRLRVRRASLDEWLRRRELAYRRSSVASELAGAFSVELGKGVA